MMCAEESCDRPAYCRGVCRRHYRALPKRATAIVPGRRPRPLADRIRSAVQVDANGCWLWLRKIDRDGYGKMTVGSQRDGTNREVGAHRVAYETFVGPIPVGLTLDHLCRVRRCVNPDHLEPATNRTNVLRGEGWAARNARRTVCAKCGGPLTYVARLGKRRCVPCMKAYHREWQRERARSAGPVDTVPRSG